MVKEEDVHESSGGSCRPNPLCNEGSPFAPINLEFMVHSVVDVLRRVVNPEDDPVGHSGSESFTAGRSRSFPRGSFSSHIKWREIRLVDLRLSDASGLIYLLFF